MAKRKVLLVDESLHREIRRRALDEGRSAKDVTHDALLDYLRRRLRKSKRATSEEVRIDER